MKRIHYIASGTSYLRLNAKRNSQDRSNSEYISEILGRVEKDSNHEFGLLYNAFTEASFGDSFKNFGGYQHVHSDSGGLQIITQGKSVTNEIKDKIYKTQAHGSDLGMCFDEIPIGMTGERSGRNDVSNRWFKSDEMEHYARKTGKNIARQMEIFEKEKSSCKPILIAQGNCYDTYMKWVEYALDEIPKEKHHLIGGVAMGAAALGTGTLEDIERAFIFTQLPIEKTHLHVLGVGSVKRLLPYIIFMQSGMYDGVTVSYDSTTHTSGVELGLYYFDTWKQISFNRKFSKIYENIFKELQSFGYIEGLNVNDFFEIMNNGFTKYTQELGKDEMDFLRTRLSFSIKSIVNFVSHVDAVVKDKKMALSVASDAKYYLPAKHLYSVKTLDDYRDWQEYFNKFVKSKRVQNEKPISLEDFFL